MDANDLVPPVDPGPNARRIWRVHAALRALHVAVLIGGALLAVGEAVGLLGTLGLVVLVLLVVMHVLGNALGTRLNRESSAATHLEDFDPAMFPPLDGWRAQLAPAREHPLSKRTSGGRLVGGITCLGMIAGGIFGGWFFFQEPTVAGAIVGTVSSVVLGGFFGFAISSCWKVTYAAWRQAKAVASPNIAPPPKV